MAAEYWISNTLQAVQDLLLACPTAATMGITSGSVYWQDARTATAPPFAIVSITGGEEAEDDALRITRHADTVSVYLCWNPGDGAGNAPAETACNQMGQLLSEIAERIGTSTYLVRARRTWEAPQRLADNHAHAGKWDALITFSWDI